jgi:mRNA-degrading endonuclease RelE of RelBE toxin-antitoxin system
MHQIVLSDSASHQLSEIDKLQQLEIVSEFSRLRKEPLEKLEKQVGKIEKGNRTLLRYRYKDYRIYFEKQGDQIVVHHVLHSNTLRDFFVRANLDISDDEFEESAKFWKFIEQREVKVKTGAKS